MGRIMSSAQPAPQPGEKPAADRYSAREQGLGYIFQPRFALYQALELSEDTAILIEKDDDLDFEDVSGTKTLASLKHKAIGDRLTDLSVDFWKSVNIWLTRYAGNGRIESNFQFFLFTTSTVASGSFLEFFLHGADVSDALPSVWEVTETTLHTSDAKALRKVKELFSGLSDSEKEDFVSRITIVDSIPRIQDLPALIKDQKMRTVRPQDRDAVFERLEGWWNDLIIQMLCNPEFDPILGSDVSEKLQALSEEYRADNLPITFEDAEPDEPIQVASDNRLFVVQLRHLRLSESRVRSAILDYYQAFEQRSAWARQRLTGAGEIEAYEERLTREWKRHRDVIFDDALDGLDEPPSESTLVAAGKQLYSWAEIDAHKLEHLKIRARVTAPYVVRGSYQMLANKRPNPPVYWHPLLLDRLAGITEETE